MNSRVYNVGVLASTLIIGGAERQLQALARGLKARGFAFHFFLLKDFGDVGYELTREGFAVEARLAARPWRWPRLSRTLAGLDLVLVLDHNNALRLAGAWAAELPPYVVLYHLQAPPPRSWRRPLAAAAAVVLVSRAQEPLLAKVLPGRPAEVIPNGVSLPPSVGGEIRTNARKALGLPADTLAALCVARLSREKGVDVLLDAAARLADESGRSLFWLIVGDGPARPALERRARNKLAPTTYNFAGTFADVGAAYAAADVFVLPSRQESTPLALLEAMSWGLPVVAAAVGDVPAILAEIGGVTFPPGNARALAAAVASVIGDDRLRADLGANGRAAVKNIYGLQHMLDRYESLFRKVIAVIRGNP